MKFPQHRALFVLLSTWLAFAGVWQANATQDTVATGLNHSLAINRMGRYGVGDTTTMVS
jgi:hypothetical protein